MHAPSVRVMDELAVAPSAAVPVRSLAVMMMILSPLVSAEPDVLTLSCVPLISNSAASVPDSAKVRLSPSTSLEIRAATTVPGVAPTWNVVGNTTGTAGAFDTMRHMQYSSTV